VSSLLRSNVTVAAGTAVSRITGLARVAVLGIVLSQGPVTDAYDQANGTPNMIYELLLGGVLSATLVPLFTRLHDDDDDEATSAVISVGIVVLAAVTALAVAAAPLIFRMYSLLTSSEVDAGQYHEAGTLLTRIFLVQIFFYGLNAIGSAVLNARRRFFAAAWAPALSNLVIIVSLLLVPGVVDKRIPQLDDVINNHELRWTLGLGATVGIAVMAFALLPALVHARMRFRFNPAFGHPAVRSLRSLSTWALGYVVANQIATIVIRNLLRGGSGDEDAYTKAFTWFVLPHGLLAVSIATTFLPELSSAIKKRDRETVLDRSSLGIRLIALVTLPAGFGLFVLRRAIVGAAFEHGKFTSANALNTSRALAGFALGLVGFSIYLFVLRVFYAHQDARTPFFINAGENLLNVVLALLFVGRWGLLGLGLSFGLAYLLAALWALQVLHYKLPTFPLQDVIASLWRMGLAALVMAEVVWVVAGLVGANSGSGALLRVVVSTIVGAATYVGVLLALGSPELDEVRSHLWPPAQTATLAE
jgi:putative peptidoglycan lipid II flippase